jgi:hypothetical protein
VLDFEQLLKSPTSAYEEGLAFFKGQGMLNKTLQRVVADLTRAGIDHVVIGAVALNQHGYKRFTEDIDILVTKEGLNLFHDRFVGLGYRPAFAGAKKQFRTTDTNVKVEFVLAGDFPGDGKPKPVTFPHPEQYAQEIDGIRTMGLAKLIELKLASGMTASDRLKDLADVQEIIKLKNLEATFADQVDESVRAKYLELWQGVARAKQGEGEST